MITIVLSGKRSDVLPLMPEIKQGNPLLPFLFNTTLEFIARAIKQEKEVRAMHIKKELNDL